MKSAVFIIIARVGTLLTGSVCAKWWHTLRVERGGDKGNSYRRLKTSTGFYRRLKTSTDRDPVSVDCPRKDRNEVPHALIRGALLVLCRMQ